jgi:His/Glu/Gln/Arg/opine family amino acid ABC transporter permease subunit
MRFEWAYVLEPMPALLEAALVTLRIAALVMALSLVGGTALTILRAMKIRAVNAVIAVVMSFVRGTPLLIQIFIAYYVLPAVGIDLGPVTAGVLAIALNSSIFMSEIMRGGLASIDPGQVEAAVSLGLKPPAIWGNVVLPQLFLRIIPTIVNEITIVVKATALLSVITVVELMRVAQQIFSSNFRPFETLVAAALIYIAINLATSRAGDLLETRLAVRRG